MVAATVVATLLNGTVITIGLVGGFIFGVGLQNVSGGAYLATPDPGDRSAGGRSLRPIKAAIFGTIAGLVGCYRGLTTKGGPKGVGVAVNETLVLQGVLALFAVNVVLTTIGVRVGTGH